MSIDLHVQVAAQSAYRIAYNAVLPEAQAIPPEELITAPTDVDTLSSAIIHKLPVIAELDDDAAKLHKLNHHDYQQLGVRAHALVHADSEYKMALAPPPAIDKKLDEIAHVKNYLLAQGEVLVLRGCISPEPIEALRFNVNQRVIASNTRNLAVYLINQWASIAGHTTLTLEELHGYEKLADEVHTAVVTRENQPRQIEKTLLVRRQIFTLVFRALRQVERAARYLHEDNADRYLPRVFANLGKRHPRAEEPEQPAPEQPVIAGPTPVVPTSAAPALPAPADDAVVPVGMPGSNPFMR